MATAPRKPAARKPPARKPAARKPAPAAAPPAKDGEGVMHSVQQAIDELDRVRDQAGTDVRRQVDAALSRMRDVAGDLRERRDERTQTIERAMSRLADDAWLQLATLAVNGMRDPDTLTELSGEIRRRRTQLRPAAKRAAKA